MKNISKDLGTRNFQVKSPSLSILLIAPVQRWGWTGRRPLCSRWISRGKDEVVEWRSSWTEPRWTGSKGVWTGINPLCSTMNRDNLFLLLHVSLEYHSYIRLPANAQFPHEKQTRREQNIWLRCEAKVVDFRPKIMQKNVYANTHHQIMLS